MIERFYLREFLSFQEAELEFRSGLIVFSGPSGSGKSILMKSLLASVGLDGVDAKLCESAVSWNIDEEKYGIDNEDTNVFRHIKKEKTRYFINNQSISKTSMEEISSGFLRHLSLKDYSDFTSEKLLVLIDSRINDSMHTQNVQTFKEHYSRFKDLVSQLRSIEEKEKNLNDLKEFAAFEISKIDAINPKIGEDNELSEIKKHLSKKEKIENSIAKAQAIFGFESEVSNALALLDIDSAFFDDAMNDLRNVFETSMEKMIELEDIDVEQVLDRIEQISELKRKYGSVEEALAYRDQKRQELEMYESIEHSKEHLISEIKTIDNLLKSLGTTMSQLRSHQLEHIRHDLNRYLDMLYLRHVTLELIPTERNEWGDDKPVLGLEGTTLEKLSSGEFNRLRLALLALKVEQMQSGGGVLMLDEIDANLSGEESMSVAKVLRHLSKCYQIFVISHQPQLTSMGDQHFMVEKDQFSRVRELSDEERVLEIARIISGEKITEQALGYAKELFIRSQGDMN